MNVKRIPLPECLFCTEPPTSPEHFVPSAIGGVLRPLILCPKHNDIVNSRCDMPLIEQLKYFVHALQVKKDRYQAGASVKGIDKMGASYIVGRDHVPEVVPRILERDADGKPTRAVFSTPEAAEKFLSSMGVGLDHPDVTIEERFEPAPPLTFSLGFGGEDGFRGILKIAYEYCRGWLRALQADPDADSKVRDVILRSGSAAPFVRWLPYGMLPEGEEAPFFSHRLIAWQSVNEVLVIVELFNCLPFVVRLPGLHLSSSALYVQGVQGESPLFGHIDPVPEWAWFDIPEELTQLERNEFVKRSGKIIESMQIGDFVAKVATSLRDAFASSTSSSTHEEILEDALTRFTISSRTTPDIVELARPLMASLLPNLRKPE